MKKLLVANRGEIARRVFRTARRMGIRTVAVFSDVDAAAPHTRDADEAVRLPGASPAETYLDITKVLDAARRTGADSVHPGYGFLSENAAFARSCAAAGLTFVGPSPDAIDAMGSKITAKELMASAGVPTLPGGTVADGYAPPIDGYPVLVKAAFGGGGRGMRIVRSPDALADAVVAAEREAAAAFGDGTVFIERYVEDPRHIEVQVFGDTHGRVIHLFERECSIQRRYQKIIEEAPSPVVDAALRARLCDAAVAAGSALGYVGAGTVEFVLDPTGDFFFLEVNTRLQVEHPVTELITGLDLVELQLRVARGEPLDVDVAMRGHAVEARLYAEDVAAGFVPASGRIERWHIPTAGGVRVDGGYETGSSVSTFYDAMLAKVIAHGPTREVAVRRVTEALVASRIHGVATNRDLLVDILRHPEFEAARTDTGFIERLELADAASSGPVELHAVAAALALHAERRAKAAVQRSIPSGWRNVGAAPQRIELRTHDRTIEVAHRFTRNRLEITVDGTPAGELSLWSATATAVDLTLHGVRQMLEVHRSGSTIYVDSPAGSATFDLQDRLPAPLGGAAPGSMLAPLPGTVTRVPVAPGEHVVAGQVLVVLEAMKMEHNVASAEDGTLQELRVAVGDQVERGQVLVVLVPDDA